MEATDPLQFESYAVPRGTLEDAILLESANNHESELDIFLSRFTFDGCKSGSIEELLQQEQEKIKKREFEPNKKSASCERFEEIITIASAEDMEKQLKAVPLDELLQGENVFDSEEKDKQEEKGIVQVDKWGFVIDEGEDGTGQSKKQQKESKKQKERDKQKESKKQKERETSRAEKWLDCLAKWDSYSDDKRRRMKAKFRKAGIPDRLRGGIWKKLTMIAELRDETPNLFQKLSEEKSEFEGQIQRDINRTFPKHIFFRERGGMGQRALFNTLKAYSVYDKKVGYCQGMGFIIALLLLYMAEEDAFYVLIRLCKDYEMSGLFEPGFPGLVKFFYIHDQLLEQFLPRIAAHFAKEMITSSMYATHWYTTIFAISLPFPFVIRIFDVFLSEGVRVIFRIALALLKAMQNELLKLNFEGIMDRLKNISKNLNVSPDELIYIAMNFSLSNKKMDKIEKEYDLTK